MGFLFRFLTSHIVEWQAHLWTRCVFDIKRNSMLSQRSFIQGISNLKAQREISFRRVHMVEKWVSFICSIYLHYGCFGLWKWGGQICLVFQYVAFNTRRITFPVQIGFDESGFFWHDLTFPLILQYLIVLILLMKDLDCEGQGFSNIFIAHDNFYRKNMNQ